mmetsp:Transcript_32814/g.65035  ORF Transcript_32814/g.65035 Transcript_32814/m.65035 type:complete len:266 (-) Transcript_32814:433-1230(-)
MEEGLTPAPHGLLVAAADSGLLVAGAWWPDCVGSAVASSSRDRIAVYLGAANGDMPDYYEIAKIAMERAGIAPSACRHIVLKGRRPSQSDLDFINSAALIILAGGDPYVAHEAFSRSGINHALGRAAAGGAVLAGVSAGAMQLGTHGFSGDGCSVPDRDPYPALGMMPFVVGAHEEAADWCHVSLALERLRSTHSEPSIGLALPFGSAIALLPDGTLIVAHSEYKNRPAPALLLVGVRRHTLPPGSRWRQAPSVERDPVWMRVPL